jgi:hypothetical protein
MINAAYEDNPLIGEIRNEYGTQQRDNEGAAITPKSVQDKFRSSITEGDEPGNYATDSSDEFRRSYGQDDTTTRLAQGRNSREGRTNAASTEDSSSSYSGYGPANNTLPASKLAKKIRSLYAKNPDISPIDAARLAKCSVSTARKHLKILSVGEHEDDREESRFEQEEEQDKPYGLESKPHYREQEIRVEQAERERKERDAADEKASTAKTNIFSFIAKSKDRSKEKKHSRSQPFSEREAEEIRIPFLAALMDYFRYTDEFIYATHRAHNHVQIWSSIDEEEAAILVDVWLAKAKTSTISASHITNIVNSHYQLKVGIILAPRFYATFQTYLQGGGFNVR